METVKRISLNDNVEDTIEVSSLLSLCNKYKGIYMYLPDNKSGVVLYRNKVLELLSGTERANISIKELDYECRVEDSKNILKLYNDMRLINHNLVTVSSNRKTEIDCNTNIVVDEKDKDMSLVTQTGITGILPLVMTTCVSQPLACIYDKGITTIVEVIENNGCEYKKKRLINPKRLPMFVKDITNMYGEFVKGLYCIYDDYAKCVKDTSILNKELFRDYSVHRVARQYLTEKEWLSITGIDLPYYLRNTTEDLTLTEFENSLNKIENIGNTNYNKDTLNEILGDYVRVLDIYQLCEQDGYIADNTRYSRINKSYKDLRRVMEKLGRK